MSTATTLAACPFSSILLPLLRTGWIPRPRLPAHDADAASFAGLICPCCGSERRKGYHPFTRGLSYKGIAQCHDCGHCEEV